jgi:hypothetical protein
LCAQHTQHERSDRKNTGRGGRRGEGKGRGGGGDRDGDRDRDRDRVRDRVTDRDRARDTTIRFVPELIVLGYGTTRVSREYQER